MTLLTSCVSLSPTQHGANGLGGAVFDDTWLPEEVKAQKRVQVRHKFKWMMCMAWREMTRAKRAMCCRLVGNTQ